jgi:hypothetical protein
MEGSSFTTSWSRKAIRRLIRWCCGSTAALVAPVSMASSTSKVISLILSNYQFLLIFGGCTSIQVSAKTLLFTMRISGIFSLGLASLRFNTTSCFRAFQI